jgi:predicted site-specific integrase-resolvase
MNDKLYKTEEAAKRAGIALVTLQRWIAGGKVKAPKLRIRNGRAVRLWATDDLDRLRQTKLAIYCRGRGRKKRSK